MPSYLPRIKTSRRDCSLIGATRPSAFVQGSENGSSQPVASTNPADSSASAHIASRCCEPTPAPDAPVAGDRTRARDVRAESVVRSKGQRVCLVLGGEAFYKNFMRVPCCRQRP